MHRCQSRLTFSIVGLAVLTLALSLYIDSKIHVPDYIIWRWTVTFKRPVEPVDDYHVVVTKSIHRLEVFHGDELVGTYPVGLSHRGLAPRRIWVDEMTQALYLKPGFDILFNEARSVNKVFWYKYMDEIVDQPNRPTLLGIQANEESRIRHPELEVFDPSSPRVSRPGFWGLYRTTKLDNKPSQCAFLYYPQRCPNLPWFTYLPLILRGQ